jgi:hypothetical protein
MTLIERLGARAACEAQGAKLAGRRPIHHHRRAPEVIQAQLLSLLARDSPAHIRRTRCSCPCNDNPRHDVCHRMRERDPMTDP